jgi:hypothetical protein
MCVCSTDEHEDQLEIKNRQSLMFAEVFSQIGRAASGDRTEYLRPFYCFADIILTLRLVLDWLTRFLTTLFEMHRLFSVE